MTTYRPIALVIGIGPTLKIIKTIKTIAHLILDRLEVFIVFTRGFLHTSNYHLSGKRSAA